MRALLLLLGRGTLAFFAASLVACGPSKGAGSPATHKFQGILRYYPLEKGWQWSFFIRDAIEGGPGLLAVTKVVEFDGHVALLSTGKELSELRVEKDGLVRVDSGAYLLKWPIDLGARWQGAKGAAVEVTKTNETIQVEAGTFEGCVETTETFRGDESKIVLTTFCPDVGPVKLDVRETNVAPGEVPAQAVATLRSFGPAVDIGAAK
jgi:hypothetical protein